MRASSSVSARRFVIAVPNEEFVSGLLNFNVRARFGFYYDVTHPDFGYTGVMAEGVSFAETSSEAEAAGSGSEWVFLNFAFIICALYLNLNNVYVSQTADYLYL